MNEPIRGKITGQSLVLEQEQVVAATRQYLTAVFSFSPEWEGLSIWAHIDKGNQHWKINLHEGKILREDQFNPGSGTWEICFHGTDAEGMRITTEPVDLRVRRTNVDDEYPLPDVPAEPAEQIDAKSQQALNTANRALEEVLKVEPLTDRAESAAVASEASAESARGAASSASLSAQSASASATSAQKSAESAKNSENTAAQSEKTAVEKAAESVENAKTAESHAKAAEVSRKAAETAEANAKGSEDKVHADALKAEQEAQNAATSASAAKTSEINAKSSETSADEDAQHTNQVMQDFLAMLDKDVPVLVGGKLPNKYLNATATQEIYEVSSEDELITLTAQRGDLAELITEVEGERTITKTWQCLGDASVRENWVVWGTAYAVQAGSANTAKTAENASMINGHRMVEMSKEQFDGAVKDPETYYLVHEPKAEV